MYGRRGGREAGSGSGIGKANEDGETDFYVRKSGLMLWGGKWVNGKGARRGGDSPLQIHQISRRRSPQLGQ